MILMEISGSLIITLAPAAMVLIVILASRKALNKKDNDPGEQKILLHCRQD